MDISTEEKILQAAEDVFLREGYDGARMQQIADRAGINKALLHYYFRWKDKLFQTIFEQKFRTFFPKIEGLIQQDLPFLEKVFRFVDAYLKILSENPYVPHFIIHGIHKPEGKAFLKQIPPTLAFGFIQGYHAAHAKGEVREVQPVQLLVSVMSMCIFPFLAKPIIREVTSMDEETFQAFIGARADEVKRYLERILLP